jgi:opacity protein-like surface antigen
MIRWQRSVVLAGSLSAMVLASVPAQAQVVQVGRGDSKNAIGFYLGGFLLRGEDGRDVDDVILADSADLVAFDSDSDRLKAKDFNNVTVGGEWLFGVGNFLEGGLGVGYYQKTVATTYTRLTNSDGSEITQDLKLRVIPMSATVRFLPIGRGAAVEPYVGAGVGIFSWRYSEIGDFVDSNDDIFPGRFVAKGTEVGPLVLAGVRVPVGEAWTVGGEVRWQSAKGDTGGIDEGFLGDKIDLSGWNAAFTMHVRF